MSASSGFNSFFSTESGLGTRLFYFSLLAVTALYSTVAIIAPVVTPKCDIPLEFKQPKHGASVPIEPLPLSHLIPPHATPLHLRHTRIDHRIPIL